MLRALPSLRIFHRSRQRRQIMRPTAGLIVIGDEILKGSTIDTNSHFISKKLHELGVQVKKITAIGDNIDDISNEIRSFSEKFDYVFTTGGVGPTHDDKTYIGVARAFNEQLRKCPEIVSVITQYIPSGPSSEQSGFVDKLSMGQLFSSSLKPWFSRTIYTSEDEPKFADSLTAIASKYDGIVEIGSYPVLKNSFFKTKLIVESESSESGQAVTDAVHELLRDAIVHYDEVPWMDTIKKFKSFRERESLKNPSFAARMDDAVAIVRKILEEYPLEEVTLSFNGGKDCTVLLHLLRLAVDEKYGPDVEIQGFHIMCEDQFPEATQFIIDAAKRYNIVVKEYPGPLKVGLELLKKEQPNVTAVLMGSRGSDPAGKYMRSPVEWTDEDWPRVLRVCPILSWSYGDVWRMLRGLCIPYCALYDMGYTSLGGRGSTVKNPLLKVVGKDGVERYMPAYTLTNGDAERNGRSSI